jgi:hypothetical protein
VVCNNDQLCAEIRDVLKENADLRAKLRRMMDSDERQDAKSTPRLSRRGVYTDIADEDDSLSNIARSKGYERCGRDVRNGVKDSEIGGVLLSHCSSQSQSGMFRVSRASLVTCVTHLVSYQW